MLGDHIRKRRLDLGLLRKQVAAQIGVDKTTVYNWERNATHPPPRSMAVIVALLGYDPYPPPKSFSERLVRARNLLGLTQKAMARRLGVDPTTLARWERGESGPSRQLLTIVRAFLNSHQLGFINSWRIQLGVTNRMKQRSVQ